MLFCISSESRYRLRRNWKLRFKKQYHNCIYLLLKTVRGLPKPRKLNTQKIPSAYIYPGHRINTRLNRETKILIGFSLTFFIYLLPKCDCKFGSHERSKAILIHWPFATAVVFNSFVCPELQTTLSSFMV